METDIFHIPNENSLLERDILARKTNYMDHVYNVFCNLIKPGNIPEKLHIFKFEDTNLEVVVKREAFSANLQNLLDYYIELELYENCNFIKNIINIIKANPPTTE